jgi:hypothetical protein
MILVEKDPLTSPHVEEVRAKVLTCLRVSHELFEFDAVSELVAYLEHGLDEMVIAGYPRKLTRIVLFYRTPAALRAVVDRMHPTGELVAAVAPQCWMVFNRRMKELITNARRIEPAWIADMLKES